MFIPGCAPTPGPDAGPARLLGLPLATRNTADFSDCGIDVINPFGSA